MARFSPAETRTCTPSMGIRSPPPRRDRPHRKEGFKDPALRARPASGRRSARVYLPLPPSPRAERTRRQQAQGSRVPASELLSTAGRGGCAMGHPCFSAPLPAWRSSCRHQFSPCHVFGIRNRAHSLQARFSRFPPCFTLPSSLTAARDISTWCHPAHTTCRRRVQAARRCPWRGSSHAPALDSLRAGLLPAPACRRS